MSGAHANLPLIEYQPPLHGRLVSVTRRVDDISPAAFLRHAQGRERVFWRDGRSGFTFAGMGARSSRRRARARGSRAIV